MSCGCLLHPDPLSEMLPAMVQGSLETADLPVLPSPVLTSKSLCCRVCRQVLFHALKFKLWKRLPRGLFLPKTPSV